MKNRGFGPLVSLMIVLGLLGSAVAQAAEKSHPIYDVIWFQGKDGVKRSVFLPHRDGRGVGPLQQYVITISPETKAAEAAKKAAKEAAAEAKAAKASAALKKAGKVAGVLVGAELTFRALQLLTDGSVGTAEASDYAPGSIIDLRTGKTVGILETNAALATPSQTVEMLPAH